MGTKDKKIKRKSVTIKKLVSFISVIITITYIYLFFNLYFAKNQSYATEVNSNEENVKISNAKKISIDQFIEKSTEEIEREEYYTEEQVLEYITKYETNTQLPKGTVQVVQEGRNGKQQITKKRIYNENGEVISEEQISAKVTTASINKIVEIGAGLGSTSSYKVKVGDKVYSTADRLSVMSEANEQSQKVATLSKGNELDVLEIHNGWYRVISGTTRGFVKSEATTYINPTKPKNEVNTKTELKNKGQLMSGLNMNMALNKPSGLTQEQFKKILTDTKDVNSVFVNNSQYFYYIEKQYNINGVFLAAMGIHESAWGTSKISIDKKNLFGYGAYDSNPYNGAYNFTNYSESIDLVARVLVKYYLNPKGTSIYAGETAIGTYYNGPTLTGINTRYASDKNWANAVFTHMKNLYNKL